MKVVSVGDRKGSGELPILIYNIKLVSRQKHGQNQPHLQLGHPHSRAKVPTGSPTKERIGSVRGRVRSQPAARIVLVRFGVVFRVKVDLSSKVHKEIPPLNDLFVNLDFFSKISSEHNTSEGDPL
jgi:hypothetical protein